ncbi:MAG TPA: YceI family protein [Acidobacteriota bacterium]|nr:YceI family protein [Acidobacteriota bacterium]
MRNRIAMFLLTFLIMTLGLTFVQAETYKIDDTHSTVHFHVKHMSAGIFVGRFDAVSGTLNYDPENPSNSSIEVTVRADSVSTNNDRLNGHIKSPDFLNAAQFPEITFKSTSVEKTGEDTYQVSGDLTIRGITKQITTTVQHTGTSEIQQKRIGFMTRFDVNRFDFDVDWGKDEVAGETVTIAFNLEGVAAE